MLSTRLFPHLLADGIRVQLFVPEGPVEQLFQGFSLRLQASKTPS